MNWENISVPFLLLKGIAVSTKVLRVSTIVMR